jgi:hypothetical protein
LRSPGLCLAHGEWKLRTPSCRRDCERILDASSGARAPPALEQAGLLPPAAAQTCRECRCRSCPACRCVDALGSILSPQVCHREEQTRRDVHLGTLGSAFDCRRACDNFTLPDRPPISPSRFQRAQLGAECTAWTFADGICIGHTDLGLASSFEPPASLASSSTNPAVTPASAFSTGPMSAASRERFDVGVVACAPDSVAAGGDGSTTTPLRFAMVHTVASAAIAPCGVHPNKGLLQLPPPPPVSSLPTPPSRTPVSSLSVRSLYVSHPYPLLRWRLRPSRRAVFTRTRGCFSSLPPNRYSPSQLLPPAHQYPPLQGDPYISHTPLPSPQVASAAIAPRGVHPNEGLFHLSLPPVSSLSHPYASLPLPLTRFPSPYGRSPLRPSRRAVCIRTRGCSSAFAGRRSSSARPLTCIGWCR